MRLGLDQLTVHAKSGVRQLTRAPLSTGVAVLTLALGIGLNTAVFSLVHGVLLRPLPYPDAERLVWIAPYDSLFGQDTWGSRGDYLIWKQQTHLFAQMTAYGTGDLNLVVGGRATQERIASIGGDFWSIVGARPVLGRLTTADEEDGLVLSYGLFQRRFGGDATAIGRSVTIAGAPFTIIGVLPERFRVTFPQQTAPGDELRDLDGFIALPRGQEPPGRVIALTSRPSPAWIRVVGRRQRRQPAAGTGVAPDA
jgi:putative ABC transport system permease protein